MPCRSGGDEEEGFRRWSGTRSRSVYDRARVARRGAARRRHRRERETRSTAVEDGKALTLTFEASMLCVRSLIVSAWLGLRAPGGVTRVQLEDSPMRARNESGEVLRRTECEGPPAAVLCPKVGG